MLDLGSRVLYGAGKGNGKADQARVGGHRATRTCFAYLAATTGVVLRNIVLTFDFVA